MPVDVESPEAIALKQKIDDQGNNVRTLKSGGSDKSVVDQAVQLLLKLKAEYKELTGQDLTAGGSSKKSKKEKKAVQIKEDQKKQAPATKKTKTEAVNKQEPATAASKNNNTCTGASAVDMSVPAVMSRLAQRASQADQIIANLRLQLTSIRQSSALSACKAEEEKLKQENEMLKKEVDILKNRLIQAEIKNGVKQVPLPNRQNVETKATESQQPNPPTTAAGRVDEAKTSSPSKPEQKKQPKEKKEPKPKAQGNTDSAPVDISRISMRVGQIVGVKRHPDADSLYVEDVNLGEGKNRTILSGLVKHIPIEQMQDRLAIFMTNLKPAKMRGIMSEGMIMCGSTPEKVEIIELPPGAKVGDKVYVEGYEGEPDAQLNPKKKIFEQVQPDLAINGEGVATYKGVPWKVQGVEGSCSVPTMRGTPIK